MTGTAFCLDGVCGGDAGLQGWNVLVSGWMEVMLLQDVDPTVGLAWLANPLLLVAWSCLATGRGRRLARACGVIACTLAAAFLVGQGVKISIGPTLSRVTDHGLGYWAWLATCALACAAAWLMPLRAPRAPVTAGRDD